MEISICIRPSSLSLGRHQMQMLDPPDLQPNRRQLNAQSPQRLIMRGTTHGPLPPPPFDQPLSRPPPVQLRPKFPSHRNKHEQEHRNSQECLAPSPRPLQVTHDLSRPIRAPTRHFMEELILSLRPRLGRTPFHEYRRGTMASRATSISAGRTTRTSSPSPRRLRTISCGEIEWSITSIARR